MAHHFRKVMKRHSFVLRLLMLFVLGASTNACIVANSQLAALEPIERRTDLALKYDGPVEFVIPEYYRSVPCGKYERDTCPSLTGRRLYMGVQSGLDMLSRSGKHGGFTENIRDQGMVCVVSVKPKSPVDAVTYRYLLSMMTLFVFPMYTPHEYVLSYNVLLDSMKIKEYRYDIKEYAVDGSFTWLLYPVMYALSRHAEIGIGSVSPYGRRAHGPLSGVIQEATEQFLVEAHRDGIF